MDQQPHAAGECLRVERCLLRVERWEWPFAGHYADRIADNWQRVQAANPAMFDGAVYLARACSMAGGRLSATLFRTDFKTFLFWRDHGALDADGVREVFGTSLVRSAEGHLLLGRQALGNLNSGHLYPPSGLIDDDDVRGESIDIDASIARELAEETGLAAQDLHRSAGYLVASAGPSTAIGIEWRSALAAAQLREKIIASVSGQVGAELEDIVIARSRVEVSAERVPVYAQMFLRNLLPP